jgi:uncharacterized protein YlaI
MGHNVTVLELAWQIGKLRHNDIISYVIKDCHSGHFVAKKIRNRNNVGNRFPDGFVNTNSTHRAIKNK